MPDMAVSVLAKPVTATLSNHSYTEKWSATKNIWAQE